MPQRPSAGWRPWWLAALCGLALASCGELLLPIAQPSIQPRRPVVSSDGLSPNVMYTPTPPNQEFPGLTATPLPTLVPQATPNPYMTPHSYLKEHQWADLRADGQQTLVIIAGDRRSSPPPIPTPVLQHQKGEYEGNFVYNLQLWNWDIKTNQYSLADSWPNDPAKRYVDMRYHLADLVNDGSLQVLVQARLEGVAEALDYAILSYKTGKLLPMFERSNLEHGQVRLVGQNVWQERAVRGNKEDPCCPGSYKSEAFFWDGRQFAPTTELRFPTPIGFPPATPTPLSRQATPQPLETTSVPIPRR